MITSACFRNFSPMMTLVQDVNLINQKDVNLYENRQLKNQTTLVHKNLKSQAKNVHSEIQSHRKSSCFESILPQIKLSQTGLNTTEGRNSSLKILISPSKSQTRLKIDSFRDSIQKEDRVSLPSINSTSKLQAVKLIAVNNFEETMISSPNQIKKKTSIDRKGTQNKRNSLGKSTKTGIFKPVQTNRTISLQHNQAAVFSALGSVTFVAADIDLTPLITASNSNDGNFSNVKEKSEEVMAVKQAQETGQFIIAEEGQSEHTSIEAQSQNEQILKAQNQTIEVRGLTLEANQTIDINDHTPRKNIQSNFASTQPSIKSPRPATTPTRETNAQIFNSDSANRSQIKSRERDRSLNNNLTSTIQKIKDEKSPRRLITQATLTPSQNPRIINNKGLDTVIISQAMFAEPFYRRAMVKLGWSLVPAQTQQLKPKFHIRFDVDDLQGTGAEIKLNQFYNHFPNNRECVTKSGLCRNLWINNLGEVENQIESLFPRCYDLADLKQTNEFIADFNQTAILSIIKMMAQYFSQTNPKIIQLVQQYRRKAEFANHQTFVSQLKSKCTQIDSKTDGNLLGSDEVRLAYIYCKQLQTKINLRINTNKRSRKQSMLTLLDDQQLQQLLDFHSKLIDNSTSFQQLKKFLQKLRFETFEQLQIVKLAEDLMAVLKQFRLIDGVHNVWIVKPSYNSRGVGIYCARQLNQIINDGKKTQQKVVQKYIEHPLCLNENKKFDLRQWVLINSWEPLDVCVFSTAYLKVCASSFDLQKLDDPLRHLSNFSINRKAVGDEVTNEDLVLSTDQFEEFMQKLSQTQPLIQKDFNWASHMLPKIKDLVWRTLKSIQETQEQKSNCFEVYGFDIVLDTEFNPWLIEVNLSPACYERTPWLTQMLDEQSLDLLNYLQSKILVANPTENWAQEKQIQKKAAFRELQDLKYSKYLNTEAFFQTNQHKNRWVRLNESIQELKLFSKLMLHEQKLELCVIGTKSDLKFERKLERSYVVETSAGIIQRRYRGFQGRLRFKFVKETKYALVIQRHWRMYLAKQLAHSIRFNNGALKIQKQLRKILALKVATKMRYDRLHKLKTQIITKLQSHQRRRKATALVKTMRHNKAAQNLQRFLRGYRSRQLTIKMRSNRRKIITIQQFYKQRFLIKKIMATTVQKMIRGFVLNRRVIRLKKICKASLIMQTVIQMKSKLQKFEKLNQHCKVIIVQKFLRGFVARARCVAKLKSNAMFKLRKMLRLFVYKHLKQVAQQLRSQLQLKAIIIQKQLRVVIACKQRDKLIKQSKTKIKQDSCATTVQKFMRSYLAQQQANLKRVKIGAAIMIQALWRGYKGRLRYIKVQLRKKKAIKNQILKEKRLADQKARDEYDPSNDNLIQIFNGAFKKQQHKVPKASKEPVKELAKEPSKDKIKQKGKKSGRNKKSVIKAQIQKSQSTQKLNLQRGKKMQQKFLKITEQTLARKAFFMDDNELKYYYEGFNNQNRNQHDLSQSSSKSISRCRLNDHEECSTPKQESGSAYIDNDNGEAAHLQSLTAMKLLGLGQKRQDDKQRESLVSTRCIQKSIETGIGNGVARTVVMKRDPSKDKMPIWAQNAFKAADPQIKPSTTNEHQILEKVFKNGKCQYKVFNVKSKPKFLQETTKLDSNNTLFQADVLQHLHHEKNQERPSNKDSKVRMQQKSNKTTQLQKTKTFAQNLMELLENQTKNSIEVRAQSNDKGQRQLKTNSLNMKSQLDQLSQERVVTQAKQKVGKIGIHEILLNGLEPKKKFAPIVLSPVTNEILKNSKFYSGPFLPPQKPHILPPVKGASCVLTMNLPLQTDKLIERLNSQEENRMFAMKRNSQDSQDILNMQSQTFDSRGEKNRMADSHCSSKMLHESHKSNFTTNYEAIKSKQAITTKSSHLLSSDQLVSEIQNAQKVNVEAVLQAHRQQHDNLNFMGQIRSISSKNLAAPLKSSSSNRSSLMQQKSNGVSMLGSAQMIIF